MTSNISPKKGEGHRPSSPKSQFYHPYPSQPPVPTQLFLLYQYCPQPFLMLQQNVEYIGQPYTMFSHPYEPARAFQILVRHSCGISIYSKYAELLHLPNVLIRGSSNPLSTAVVAAPFRKLCPAYWESFSPALVRAALTYSSLVRGRRSSNWKIGPATAPCTAR